MFFSLLSTFAFADPAGDAELARVDAAVGGGQDAHLVLQLTVADTKGNTTERTLEIWQEGDDRRLVRYTEPARLAGTALLVPDGQTVYVYLPAYGKPRRVVGEQRSDAFVGTDFSIDDLSRMAWAPDYTAVIEADEGANLRLLLTPKDPSAHRHAKVRVWVRESDHLPVKVEYLAADGTPLRRLTFSGYTDAGGRLIAHNLKVEELEKGTWTEATVREATLDKGIDDAVFEVARLGQ